MSRGHPERTCVGCRRVASQSELIRVAKAADGSLQIGRSVPGRGAWLCRGSTECFERSLHRNLARSLRVELSPDRVESFRARLSA